MKRILIIGCPGSGKSTLGRILRTKLGIEMVHLDAIFWNEDGTSIDKELFKKKLREELVKESWIIDGNYRGTMEERLAYADTIIFLDYPTDICLQGIKERRGQKRSDMPWVEDPNSIDDEFVGFVMNYETEEKPWVYELLAKQTDKEIHVFKNRVEADKWVEELR